MPSYLEILLPITFTICFVFLCYTNKWRSKRNSGIKTKLFTNWPIVGMLPTLLKNSHRIHDFATDALRENGGTLSFVGPWFANMDMLVTSDPANVDYILSKHFSNFPKGPKFKTIFAILGDGIINADSKSWEDQRRMTMSLVNQHKFQKLVVKTSHDKVVNGLIPIFESFAYSGIEVDLQDIFNRLTFDSTCKMVLGHDPGYLSVDLPDCALERAVSDSEEAVLYRHVLPEYVWKLQKWLKIGREYKFTKGQKILESFISQCISMKREKLKMEEHQEKDLDLLTGYLESRDDQTFLRDIVMNLFLAGTNTISATLEWFFWLLSENPSAEKKILEEIVTVLNPGKPGNKVVFKIGDIEEATMKMVYLHGAICEALRLYPPVPINHKYSLEKDVLPSGDIVEENTRVLLCFSAMGKMESIWGKDCLEFKPERWITQQGGIKHEPSSKFTAFNTGPRSCLGKNMSLVQMKITVISVIYNFSIHVTEGHSVSPRNSVVMQMKSGLKVRISRRHV